MTGGSAGGEVRNCPRWVSGCSRHDPEAHYSMKRGFAWLGYKVHVTRTCDDGAAHLITHVETCPSIQPDMASTSGIHERLAARASSRPSVNSGYVDAALLVSSRRDHGVSLEGPVRGVADRQARMGQGYEQRHFTIDWEHERVACRRAGASATWRTERGKDGSPRIQAVFSRADCRACTARMFSPTVWWHEGCRNSGDVAIGRRSALSCPPGASSPCTLPATTPSTSMPPDLRPHAAHLPRGGNGAVACGDGGGLKKSPTP